MTRHPADLLSLAFGLLFTAVGVALLLGGDIDALSLEWLAPVAAVLLGTILIVAGRPPAASTEED